MQYLFGVLTLIFIFGCSNIEEPSLNTNKKPKIYTNEIYDLINVPQKIEHYTEGVNFTNMSYINQEKFEKSYFSVWNLKKPSISVTQIKWPFKIYGAKNSYGENLQALNKNFFDNMYEESNFDAFGTVNRRAITLKHLNIRAMPTLRPLLLNPSKAGEGFPFDYLQNSSIGANKPIYVSHYSLTKEWVFVESSFAYGWVKASEIVFLDKKYTDLWQKSTQLYVIKDNTPIFNEEGKFLFNSKLGTLLPLIKEDEESYTLLTISSSSKHRAYFNKSKIEKDSVSVGSLAFNNSNFENIINIVTISNYGWGGMYKQRDCSSMLRDAFAPFGIWLPRNSYKQSLIGEVISLEGLSDKSKIALIKERAIPLKTLLYKKGHIMLYVGVYNNEVIILHNTWGIKTKKENKEGRIIIGKAIFSTLKLGSHQRYFDESAELLKNLKSMNILND